MLSSTTLLRVRSSRKLLEVDFFVRSKLPSNARKWNLASLAAFLLFTRARLTLKTSPGGTTVYGNLKDGTDAANEIETICDWLMDPIACPTTWPILLTIRNQNQLYGTSRTPAVV